MASTPEPLVARWLGRVRFADCLAQQLEAREAVIEGAAPAQLLLVEHPPTVTLGRRASPDDVLWSSAQLEAQGLDVCETPRGGEATLHAPGQLVCYPVVRVGRQIRAHIVRLAEVTIELLAAHGVSDAAFRMETPGVFTEAGKLASIGIHVSRGVTVQGISINVDVAPVLFQALVSCGTPEMRMLSLKGLTGAAPPLPTLARAWAQRYAAASGHALTWAPSAAPHADDGATSPAGPDAP